MDADRGTTPERPGSRSTVSRHEVGWTRARRITQVVFLLALVAIVVHWGIPTGRQMIAVLLIIGLSTTRIGAGWGPFVRVTIDWLPFTLVLIAYDKTRGVTDAIGLPLHEGDIVQAEKWVCGGYVPTVWLQQHLYNATHVYWYDVAVTLVYATHFLATPAVAAWLWLRDRAAWLGFIWRVIVLSVAGLVTYVLFPEAPPWLAGQDGYLSGHVARLSARGFIWLHLGNVNEALGHAQASGSNPVAAMPSLHVGFATLIAIFLASRVQSRWRYLLGLYPLAMGFTLVYTGEHYVLDLVAGAGYALAAHLALTAWELRRAGRAHSDHVPAVVGSPVSTAPGTQRVPRP